MVMTLVAIVILTANNNKCFVYVRLYVKHSKCITAFQLHSNYEISTLVSVILEMKKLKRIKMKQII